MKGRKEDAKRILMKATKTNKTSLSVSSLSKLDQLEEPRNADDKPSGEADENTKTSYRLVLMIANISFVWFSTIFVYQGLNINAVYLEYWNKYVSFIVSVDHDPCNESS